MRIFTLCILLATTSHAAQDYAALAKDLVKKTPGTQIYLLGEAGHGQKAQFVFLEALVKELGPQLKFVGFEIDATSQPELDLAVEQGKGKGLIEVQEEGAEHAFDRALIAIRDASALPLALDAPAPKDTDGAKKIWFLSRDAHMVYALESAAGKLEGKGILFLGAAHVSKKPWKVPGVLQPVVGTGEIVPLGARMKGWGKLTHVWFQPKLTKGELESHVPVEWWPSYAIAPLLKGTGPWSTSSTEFKALESEQKPSDLKLSEGFDFVLE